MKNPRHNQEEKVKKIPISIEDGNAYLKERPLWSFKKLDNSGQKWQISNLSIVNQLKAYEGMTWSEISSSSGGKAKGNGSNSHFVSISNLSREAKQRIIDINLGSEDVLYSLRLGSRKRLYGILNSRIFEIIWYDENHEIYPLDV